MNKRMRVLAAVIVMAAVMLACAMPSIQAQLQPEDIKSISDSGYKPWPYSRCSRWAWWIMT